MSNPTKIKVKQVEAADPELKITLQAVNAGQSFPAYVKAAAVVDWNQSSYPAEGVASNVPSGTTQVLVIAPFTDPSYQPGQRMTYDITHVWFSDTGRLGSWVLFTGDLEDNSGSVIAGQ